MNVLDLAVPLGDGVVFQAQRICHPASRGPTVVFLHESLGNIALWKRFPAQLAERTGLDVLVYERQGYGASTDEVLPRPYRYQEDEGAIWLPRLLDALGINEVVLIGHSDGGSIALVAAGALGSRARGLVTIAAHTWADHLTESGIRAMMARYDKGLREKLQRHHGERTDELFRAWHGIWLDEGFQQWLDFSHWMDVIDCPALIMQGEDDEYGVPEQVTDIVDGIGPNARAAFIEGTGHAPHLEQPERVLALIYDFLLIVNGRKGEGFV
ncbi:alpha/beta fold hydrolase [Marinobacter caseinilyticus]|uniref:alpha/beta fold hydrolase n=1 Tax=Marinobacter caseinilyticus TaxID=2692195 RepID=UPI00140C3511|nr:alpha/beta hydrolase [Marinobacter caseinilyticus]